ncbi:hypothetical protein BU17DRAFT_87513 [Hysterangium stoloniferum]|nr:hypothetical protein BU17DRAFT_87513 [Hysterangium stoloniferum]
MSENRDNTVTADPSTADSTSLPLSSDTSALNDTLAGTSTEIAVPLLENEGHTIDFPWYMNFSGEQPIFPSRSVYLPRPISPHGPPPQQQLILQPPLPATLSIAGNHLALQEGVLPHWPNHMPTLPAHNEIAVDFPSPYSSQTWNGMIVERTPTLPSQLLDIPSLADGTAQGPQMYGLLIFHEYGSGANPLPSPGTFEYDDVSLTFTDPLTPENFDEMSSLRPSDLVPLTSSSNPVSAPSSSSGYQPTDRSSVDIRRGGGSGAGKKTERKTSADNEQTPPTAAVVTPSDVLRRSSDGSIVFYDPVKGKAQGVAIEDGATLKMFKHDSSDPKDTVICTYIDPWQTSRDGTTQACGEKMEQRGWYRHFECHIYKEMRQVEYGTINEEEAVAMKDRAKFDKASSRTRQCSRCQKWFSRPDALKRHIKAKHPYTRVANVKGADGQSVEEQPTAGPSNTATPPPRAGPSHLAADSHEGTDDEEEGGGSKDGEYETDPDFEGLL